MDAQQWFLQYLLHASQYLTEAPPIAIDLWQAASSAAVQLSTGMAHVVFYSGGLSAKLEEKGKAVPLPSPCGYGVSAEPLLCTVVQLLLKWLFLPVVKKSQEVSASPQDASGSVQETGQPCVEYQPTGECVPFDPFVERKAHEQAPAADDLSILLEQAPAVSVLAEMVSAEGESMMSPFEPVGECLVEPVGECMVEPVSENVVKPVSDCVGEPVSEGVVEPVSSNPSATRSADCLPLAHFVLFKDTALAQLLTALNQCRYWHRPASVPNTLSYTMSHVEFSALMFTHCRLASLTNTQAANLSSVLVALFVELAYYLQEISGQPQTDQLLLIRTLMAQMQSALPVTSNSGAQGCGELTEACLLVHTLILGRQDTALQFFAQGMDVFHGTCPHYLCV